MPSLLGRSSMLRRIDRRRRASARSRARCCENRRCAAPCTLSGKSQGNLKSVLRSCGAMWRRRRWRQAAPRPHSTGVPASRSRSALNDSFMRFHSGPGLPSPTGRPSMRRDRDDVARRCRDPHLVRGAQLVDADASDLDGHDAVGELERDIARRAGQDATAVRRRHDRALRHDEDARRRAFEHFAVADDDRFLGAGIRGAAASSARSRAARCS